MISHRPHPRRQPCYYFPWLPWWPFCWLFLLWQELVRGQGLELVQELVQEPVQGQELAQVVQASKNFQLVEQWHHLQAEG